MILLLVLSLVSNIEHWTQCKIGVCVYNKEKNIIIYYIEIHKKRGVKLISFYCYCFHYLYIFRVILSISLQYLSWHLTGHLTLHYLHTSTLLLFLHNNYKYTWSILRYSHLLTLFYSFCLSWPPDILFYRIFLMCGFFRLDHNFTTICIFVILT